MGRSVVAAPPHVNRSRDLEAPRIDDECGSQTKPYVPFFSLRTTDLVPVNPTPVTTLSTPGPVRWKSCPDERSVTVKRYGTPALSFVTFLPSSLRLIVKPGRPSRPPSSVPPRPSRPAAARSPRRQLRNRARACVSCPSSLAGLSLPTARGSSGGLTTLLPARYDVSSGTQAEPRRRGPARAVRRGRATG